MSVDKGMIKYNSKLGVLQGVVYSLVFVGNQTVKMANICAKKSILKYETFPEECASK